MLLGVLREKTGYEIGRGEWRSEGCSYDLLFFFQAEDGIRDHCVTGVQTCALPISLEPSVPKQKTIGTTHF